MSGKQEFDTSPISSSINNTSEKCRSALNETFSLSPAASPAEKPEASDEATVVRGPIVASTPLLGLKTMSLASATPAKQQEKLSGTYTLLPDQPITPSLKPISLTSDKLNDTYDKHKTFRITSDTEVPKRPALLVPGRKSVVNKSEIIVS